jgi:hypothetical protein
VKKIFIAALIVSVVMASFASAQRAQWLWGTVKHRSGDPVGSGKTVQVWLTETTYERVHTYDDSLYHYSFYPGTYFEKVSCGWEAGNKIYYGETIIQTVLYEDSQYNIIVDSKNKDDP